MGGHKVQWQILHGTEDPIMPMDITPSPRPHSHEYAGTPLQNANKHYTLPHAHSNEYARTSIQNTNGHYTPHPTLIPVNMQEYPFRMPIHIIKLFVEWPLKCNFLLYDGKIKAILFHKKQSSDSVPLDLPYKVFNI